MNTSQIITELESFASNALLKFKPTAHEHLRPGSIPRMQAFIPELTKKYQEYADAISEKVNMLYATHKEKAVNKEELKETLRARGLELTKKFMVIYKPK